MNPEQWLSLKWNGGSTMSDRWLNQSKIIQFFCEITSPIRINTVPMIEITVIFSCKINTESITVITGDT